MTEKGKFLHKINEAFVHGDVDFLAENVTDSITWNVVGEYTIEGKEAFIEKLKSMATEDTYDLKITHTITHGDSAAVDGTMTDKSGEKTYGFCDVYQFSGFKNPKIKAMTTYVVEIKN